MKLRLDKHGGKRKGDDSRTCLRGKVPRNDPVFTSLLEAYDHREHACLVPYGIVGEGSRLQVEFDTTSLVALPDYLDVSIDSEQFIVIVESLLRSFDEVDRLGIRYDYLLLEPEWVFVNTVEGALSFILSDLRRPKRAAVPGLDVFRIIGAKPVPRSFEDRRLVEGYLSGLDTVANQGISGYRWFAGSFVDRYRGVVEQPDDPVRAPSQRFTKKVLYDAQEAAELAEASAVPGGGAIAAGRSASAPRALRLTGAADARFWNVERLPCTIGSGAEADCRIESNRWVSRLHARLAWNGRNVIVEDLGSTNGTRVNGELVAEGSALELHEGDVIELANEALRVSLVDG